jgi:hypothetical protein
LLFLSILKKGIEMKDSSVVKTRRRFIRELSSAAVAGTAGIVLPCTAASSADARTYSVSLLGDTHFDSVDPRFYHKDYTRSTSPARFKAHCAEHVRNAEMWASRMPSLIRASAACRRPDTAFVMQAGDFIQGDCGNPAVHRRMLDDAFKFMKDAYGGNLPVVPAVGNHDIRGALREDGAFDTLHSWYPGRMSEELGSPVKGTTFSFRQGPDAYIVVDFNSPGPDLALLKRLLGGCEDARYVFLLTHGPFIPSGATRWLLYGSQKDNEKRRELTAMLARRNAIVIAGHTHRLEYYDCAFPQGRITQLVVNSVWTEAALAVPEIIDSGVSEYGRRAQLKPDKKPGDARYADLAGYVDEFRPYVKNYLMAKAAGHYLMEVSDKSVKVSFYGGDSTKSDRTFVLRA